MCIFMHYYFTNQATRGLNAKGKRSKKKCLHQKFAFIIKTWCIDLLPGSFVVTGLRLVPEKKRRQFLEATTPRLKFVSCTF